MHDRDPWTCTVYFKLHHHEVIRKKKKKNLSTYRLPWGEAVDDWEPKMGKSKKKMKCPARLQKPWVPASPECVTVSKMNRLCVPVGGGRRGPGAQPAPKVHFSAGVGQTKGKERKEESPREGPSVMILAHHEAAPLSPAAMRLCNQGLRSCFGSSMAITRSQRVVQCVLLDQGPGGREEGACPPQGLARIISTWPTGGWSVVGSCRGGILAGGPQQRMSYELPSLG